MGEYLLQKVKQPTFLFQAMKIISFINIQYKLKIMKRQKQTSLESSTSNSYQLFMMKIESQFCNLMIFLTFVTYFATKIFIITQKKMSDIKQIRIKDKKVSPYFQLVTQKIKLSQEAIVVKVLCFSLDPVMRVWLSGAKTNYRQVIAGDIFNCFGLGLIQKSKDEDFPVGSYLFGNTGTTNYFELTQQKQRQCFQIDKQLVEMYGPQKFIYLINNGLAAYAGYQILSPQKGENIVVSTAAGATGLLLCHLLHKKQANIIAISSKNKEKYLKQYTEHQIDYNDRNKMINYLSKINFSKYFDNVGESQLDIILSLIENHGILAICGAIQNYTNPKEGGIYNYVKIILKRLKLEGINFSHQFPKAKQIFDEYKDANLLIRIVGMNDFIPLFQQIFTKGGSIVGKIIIDPHK